MKNNILQVNKNQKGVILVMSMLILSIMMISVLALSKIIMGEINMTRNIDNNIVAFHAAESGIEKALYYIKYSVDNRDFTTFDNLVNTYDFDDDFEREFKITEASKEAAYWEKHNVEWKKPVHVSMIDPSGDISSTITGKTNYKVEWSIDNCSNHMDDKLEITLESFKNHFNNTETDKHIVTCGSCNEDLCAGDSTGTFSSNIDSNSFYRFSFNIMDGDPNPYYSHLVFTAYDDSATQGILSEASIKVEGNYRNSVQHLQARLPSLGSVSDIFSYVVFSGSTLSKIIEGAADGGANGCTDPAADNYNSNAIEDDGSCTYAEALSCNTCSTCTWSENYDDDGWIKDKEYWNGACVPSFTFSDDPVYNGSGGGELRTTGEPDYEYLGCTGLCYYTTIDNQVNLTSNMCAYDAFPIIVIGDGGDNNLAACTCIGHEYYDYYHINPPDNVLFVGEYGSASNIQCLTP